MKYVFIFIFIAIITLLGIVSSAPLKKLKCTQNTCYILEKTYWQKKAKIKQKFYKNEVRYVDIATQDGTDYLVIKTYSKDIYLKFIHTTRTAFKTKSKLKSEMNLFFVNMVNSDKPVETKWQRDYSAIQIYMFGRPMFQ